MADVCDYEKCPRFATAKWLPFTQKSRHYRVFEKNYCSSECLRWGVIEVLKNELDKVKRMKVDIKKSKLGAIFIADGIITKEQLEVALKLQQWSAHKPIGECLIELGYITREQLTFYISQQERVPFLKSQQINAEDTYSLPFPLHLAKLAQVIPHAFDYFARDLSLACLPPLSKENCAAIGRVLECDALPFLVDKDVFDDLLRLFEQKAKPQDIHLHDSATAIRQTMDIFKLADTIVAGLQPEDESNIYLALVHDQIWLRISGKAAQSHHFFPVTLAI
jgi:hypothetical protein